MLLVPPRMRRSTRAAASMLLAIVATATGAACAADAPVPPTVTAEQLKALLPDEHDLQGFVQSGFTRLRPACDTATGSQARMHRDRSSDAYKKLSPFEKMAANAAADARAGIVPQEISDGIGLGRPWHPESASPVGGPRGTYSGITRELYTADRIYALDMTVTICDAATTAQQEAKLSRQETQAMFQPGTYTNSMSLGDASWVNPGSLLFIYGNAIVDVYSRLSSDASSAGVRPQRLPGSIMESVARLILMRLARQPGLTQVPAEVIRVSINGTTLAPHAALLVGKQVYVPVTEFATAAGWKSDWDLKTGYLTLTSSAQRQITLTAGSTAVNETGATPAALKCQVLKEADQPVMLLDDLLTLTKGRIASHDGNTYKVTV